MPRWRISLVTEDTDSHAHVHYTDRREFYLVMRLKLLFNLRTYVGKLETFAEPPGRHCTVASPNATYVDYRRIALAKLIQLGWQK